jgi:acetolactate synthase-1/3 small subunit
MCVSPRRYDAQVVVEHLVEQLRKIIDVKHVVNLDLQQTLVRELALIQVDTTQADINTIINAGQQFGATVIDVTPETVTFEVTGRGERVEQVIAELNAFGVRDISRSGCVAMARFNNDANQ